MTPAAHAATLDSGPSSTGQATVHVAVGISFAFNGSPSFTLTPNVSSPAAINFTVSTNNQHGATVTLSGTDPATAGGASFPATSLSYTTFSGGSEVDQGPQQLTGSAATVTSFNAATGGTGFQQTWLASLGAQVPPGDYQSTLTYVASVNP
jgi:hypothetical protein